MFEFDLSQFENERFFNTAGPIKKKLHYYLPPLERFDLREILGLIRQEKYFILHAPRQVGKTTFMMALMDFLNQSGRYKALYVNVETAQANREDVDDAMHEILRSFAREEKLYLQDSFIQDNWQSISKNHGGSGTLNELLTAWAQSSPKPIVLMLDEVDALIGDTLISLLRQLRSGYASRPRGFPHSIILCGIRDVRDYRIHSSREKTIITGGSAFNIKAKSLRMGDFTKEETHTLYQQHTEATGQPFTQDALDLLWDLTQGQPWIVNAMGYELTYEMHENRDRTVTLTANMVNVAKERLIQRRDTHLDQLTDKLKEPRVKEVIGPILSSKGEIDLVDNDNIAYVRDLGLIRRFGKQLQIANPIYSEIIPRELNYSTQFKITHETEWYVNDDGRLNMPKLLEAFQQFFRRHSESWVERFDYKEAGPQLLMQAFLQRIVNGGGRIEREYGFGRERTDLYVHWPIQPQNDPPIESVQWDYHTLSDVQTIVIELKIRYGDLEQVIQKGLQQTHGYMDKSEAEEGHLLIFDRSVQKRTWDEKIFVRTEAYEGKTIMVWGM
ncbi:MAG: AAA-like domain-containing protein [Chloroflexota bacterium]